MDKYTDFSPYTTKQIIPNLTNVATGVGQRWGKGTYKISHAKRKLIITLTTTRKYCGKNYDPKQ